MIAKGRADFGDRISKAARRDRQQTLVIACAAQDGACAIKLIGPAVGGAPVNRDQLIGAHIHHQTA